MSDNDWNVASVAESILGIKFKYLSIIKIYPKHRSCWTVADQYLMHIVKVFEGSKRFIMSGSTKSSNDNLNVPNPAI